jgi:hypothetical protein
LNASLGYVPIINGALKIAISLSDSLWSGFSSFKFTRIRKKYSILNESPDSATVGQILEGIGSFKLKVPVKSIGPVMIMSEVTSRRTLGPTISDLKTKGYTRGLFLFLSPYLFLP